MEGKGRVGNKEEKVRERGGERERETGFTKGTFCHLLSAGSASVAATCTSSRRQGVYSSLKEARRGTTNKT